MIEGTLLAGRYEVDRKVGAGGMSDVYRAKDRVLGRNVAIKVLKQEFSEDRNFVSKFRTEAQSAAGLEHPNIVNIYDVGIEEGMYYIVMEYVDGITLKTYIEKKGQLNFKESVSIAIQVARGIEAAHNKDIIHRDIKPQNIIISSEGKVKVTDFGIARAASANTISSDVMGSVHYASPEQARNGFVDERSDIYSLGIVMYEMITGRVPFDGETTVAVAIQHLQDEMVPPSKYAPDIPKSFEMIIRKCTQKSQERRYQNIGEVMADLRHSLVDPDGDFVVIPPLFDSGKTRVIGKEEVREIRKYEAAIRAAKLARIENLDDPEEKHGEGKNSVSDILPKTGEVRNTTNKRHAIEYTDPDDYEELNVSDLNYDYGEDEDQPYDYEENDSDYYDPAYSSPKTGKMKPARTGKNVKKLEEASDRIGEDLDKELEDDADRLSGQADRSYRKEEPDSDSSYADDDAEDDIYAEDEDGDDDYDDDDYDEDDYDDDDYLDDDDEDADGYYADENPEDADIDEQEDDKENPDEDYEYDDDDSDIDYVDDEDPENDDYEDDEDPEDDDYEDDEDPEDDDYEDDETGYTDADDEASYEYEDSDYDEYEEEDYDSEDDEPDADDDFEFLVRDFSNQKKKEKKKDNSGKQKKARNTKARKDDSEEDTAWINPRLNKAVTIMGLLCAIGLVVLILYLIGGVFGLFRFTGKNEGQETEQVSVEKVEMISILGDDYKDAEKELKKMGLSMNVEDIRESDRNEGTVIQQDYKEGDMVEVGTEIQVVIAGVNPVEIPSVIGYNETTAVQTLASANLTTQKSFEYSDTVPEGTVISQSPDSGKVTQGTVVKLVISQGSETDSVPNVVGKSEAYASTSLTDAGFRVNVKYSYSNTVNNGFVIKQNPESGKTLQTGKTITITVSQGPESKAGQNNMTDTESENSASENGSETAEETGSQTDGEN